MAVQSPWMERGGGAAAWMAVQSLWMEKRGGPFAWLVVQVPGWEVEEDLLPGWLCRGPGDCSSPCSGSASSVSDCSVTSRLCSTTWSRGGYLSGSRLCSTRWAGCSSWSSRRRR